MRKTRAKELTGRKATIGVAFVVMLASWACTASAELAPDRFARWEPEVQKFERRDAEQPPTSGGVLFTGSSSIRMWDLEKWFGNQERLPLNRGFGGSRIEDAIHFADRLVLNHKPRTIVFYAGDNDIASGKSPQEVADDFASFCELIHDELPQTKIAFISIKPSPSRWKFAEKMQTANGLIRTQCEADERLVFVNVWPSMIGRDGKPRAELFLQDKLHLNDAGYELWTELVKPLFEK